jgi:dolichol-phosphate mannosyltransferase
VRAGLAGALVLCLSARFVYLGRLLTTDALLAACVAAAWAAAHRALCGARSGTVARGWWLLSALACALGLLAKGPVALVLVTVPVLAYQGLDRRAARPSWSSWALYLAAAVGAAAPWYAAQEAAQPGFLADFLWRQHVLRFTAPFDHPEPAWFFLPGLLLGMLPWTLLLPGLVRFLGRHSARAAARRPAGLGFVLLAFLWSLLFFSASGCKRATYILPAMPPLALALGCYLDAIAARALAARADSALARHGAAFAHRATRLVLVAGVAAGLAAPTAGLLRWPAGLLLAAAAAGGLVAVARPDWRGRPRVAWGLCVATTFGLLFAGVYGLLPGYARKFSLRGHVRPLADEGADPTVPVVCYPRRWHSVSFYLRRDDVRVYTPAELPRLVEALRAHDETLVFVKTGAPFDELLAGLPPGLEFVAQGRQGALAVGRVRHRLQLPDAVFAQSGR